MVVGSTMAHQYTLLRGRGRHFEITFIFTTVSDLGRVGWLRAQVDTRSGQGGHGAVVAIVRF